MENAKIEEEDLQTFIKKATDINLQNWLAHLDICKLQRRGQCPNKCADGQHLWNRAHGTTKKGN